MMSAQASSSAWPFISRVMSRSRRLVQVWLPKAPARSPMRHLISRRRSSTAPTERGPSADHRAHRKSLAAVGVARPNCH